VTVQIYAYEDVQRNSIAYFKGDTLAGEVFAGKYALQDLKGQFYELTPTDMHWRLAREFARMESKYPNPMSELEIFNLFSDEDDDSFGSLIPQGSPMSAIGNPFQTQTPANCYVIPSPLDSYGGIMRTDQQFAQIMKRRGGVGTDISTLRPNKSPARNAARSSTGITSFMERFSNTCNEVGQGGRRGAEMLTVSVHHPDIFDFVRIKRDLKKVTGANISVRLSDEFMEAVRDGGKVQLRFPVGKNVPHEIETYVDAKELWDEIITSAWSCAEPGLLFWDQIIRESPADIYSDFGFETLATNPCVTEDTWVLTKEGPRQVKTLLGRTFEAQLSVGAFPSTEEGFFHTGKKPVFLVKTHRGYAVKATADHKVLTLQGWKTVSELSDTDSIVVEQHTNFSWGPTGEFDVGWLLGSLFGDGNLEVSGTANLDYWGGSRYQMRDAAVGRLRANFACRSDLGIGEGQVEYDRVRVRSAALYMHAVELGMFDPQTREKVISPQLEIGSSSFCAGVLSGWFDADGGVQGIHEKGFSIRLGSSKLAALYAAQRMLSRLGILSTVYPERRPAGSRSLPDGRGGYKDYICEADHELTITGKSMRVFADRVGFTDPEKRASLEQVFSEYKNGPYAERWSSRVVEILPLGEEDVYDAQIFGEHAFDANGLHVHNCGEIPKCAYDSCRLLVNNLRKFVRNAYTPQAFFDFDGYRETVIKAMRLMDDLVDLDIEAIDKILTKVNDDPEPDEVKAVERELWQNIRRMAEMGRRTGLGPTALGDTLAALGVRYGTPEAVDWTERLYKAQCLAAYRGSITLAKERGAFSIFDWEREKDHVFLKRVLDADPTLEADWKKYGRRNIAILTTAPTGSVSIMTQTTSGCEPAFMLWYTRRKKINPSDFNARVDFTDAMGVKWQEYKVYHHGFKEWMAVTGKTEADVEESPYWKATSADVDWVMKVDMQAAAQRWIDHSISSTTNMPREATKELVSEVYMRGWTSGCKGLTVYRDGSRDGVLITERKVESPEDAYEVIAKSGKLPTRIISTNAPKRPKELPCDIHRSTVKGDQYMVLIGLLDGKPYEIFCGLSEHIEVPKKFKSGILIKNGKSKEGVSIYDLSIPVGEDEKLVFKDVATLFDNPTHGAFTRTISLALRHGVPVSFLCEQMRKDRHSDMFSFSTVIARVLAKNYISDDTEAKGLTCKACNGTNVAYQEGCLTCKDCGSSKCS
jgi:ribonucleotide reductase alpha subunit